MSDYYMNNPLMNLWKNFFENPSNPMATFIKNMEYLKSMMPGSMPNFGSFMNMQGFNPASFNPANHFNFAENFKDMGGFADTSKLSMENAQAIVRRQTEILQKHAQELAKLVQKAFSTTNPEETINRNRDYLHSAFDLLIADFKELTELYTKANMETFEAVSNRFKEHLEKISPCPTGTPCGSAAECSSDANDSGSKKKK